MTDEPDQEFIPSPEWFALQERELGLRPRGPESDFTPAEMRFRPIVLEIIRKLEAGDIDGVRADFAKLKPAHAAYAVYMMPKAGLVGARLERILITSLEE